MDGLSGLFTPGEGVARVEDEGKTALKDSRLEEVEKGILSAVERLKGKGERDGKARVLLVLDGLDLLLATMEAEALAVGDLVGELREVRDPVISIDTLWFCRKDLVTNTACSARPRYHHHRLRRLPSHAIASYAPRD